MTRCVKEELGNLCRNRNHPQRIINMGTWYCSRETPMGKWKPNTTGRYYVAVSEIIHVHLVWYDFNSKCD